VYEANLLNNGRFDNKLSNWTAVPPVSYDPHGGADEIGCAKLDNGGELVQLFTVPYSRKHTLHFNQKADSAFADGENACIMIVDGYQNLVKQIDLSIIKPGVWNGNTYEIGLAAGSYTFHIYCEKDGLYVDDVWLWALFTTRTKLAEEAADRLGSVALKHKFTTTPSYGKSEGSYTLAVDQALRSVGSIRPEDASPDVRYLGPEAVETAVDAVVAYMLKVATMNASGMTDLTVDGRQESFSQEYKALSELAGSSGGTGTKPVQVRKIYRGDGR
jgi:hypothetical protein